MSGTIITWPMNRGRFLCFSVDKFPVFPVINAIRSNGIFDTLRSMMKELYNLIF